MDSRKALSFHMLSLRLDGQVDTLESWEALSKSNNIRRVRYALYAAVPRPTAGSPTAV